MPNGTSEQNTEKTLHVVYVAFIALSKFRRYLVHLRTLCLVYCVWHNRENTHLAPSL